MTRLPPFTFRLPRLVTQRDGNYDPTHNIIYLEIPFRAVGVRVVAPDTRLGDSPVGVDRYEKLLLAACDGTSKGTTRVPLDLCKTFLLELSSRPILLVNGPEADQAVTELRAGHLGEGTRLYQELGR
jgi:hypothetical protein